MATLDKGMDHIRDGMEREGTRFHHATQNNEPFNYRSFISGIFHSIILDHGWLQVFETTKSKTRDKGGLLYKQITSKKDPEKLVIAAASQWGKWVAEAQYGWMLLILITLKILWHVPISPILKINKGLFQPYLHFKWQQQILLWSGSLCLASEGEG